MTDKCLWFPHIENGDDRTALIDSDQILSYSGLSARVNRVVGGLLDGADSLYEERVGFLYPASFDYAALIIGVVAAGGVAVPLSVHASADELAHCLSVTGVKRLVLPDTLRSEALNDVCAGLAITQLAIDALPSAVAPDAWPIRSEQGALVVFTSGTTGKPKGVVHTVASISAMVTSLIVNILLCALWRGATVHLYARFDPECVSRAVAEDRFSVFMAVPTIYVKLIAYLKTVSDTECDRITEGFANMRLTVSGSAACPVSLFEAWEALTSQRFLERYGMTELGMALSNPYTGERRPGHVGQPLPGVMVKRVDESGAEVMDPATPGELAVRSPTVFREYWGDPEATRAAFSEGWFLTGDIAVLEDGAYRILGRASIDIIKSGGYKLSALEIEATLLEHPSVIEVAVIGVPDDEWGEIVAAAIVLDAPTEEAALIAFSREKMSGYKVPRKWVVTDALPRNALGKVTKPALRAWF
jgi:malonyl-CoA/methylmalonyl-CoA synthetase